MVVLSIKVELLEVIVMIFDCFIIDFVRGLIDCVREVLFVGYVVGIMMSLVDLVVYLIGWNDLVFKWLDCDDWGELVDFFEVGFKWNEFGLLVQKFYWDYEVLDWVSLLVCLIEVKIWLVNMIFVWFDVEFYGGFWYGKWMKGWMIQFNMFFFYVNV